MQWRVAMFVVVVVVLLGTVRNGTQAALAHPPPYQKRTTMTTTPSRCIHSLLALPCGTDDDATRHRLQTMYMAHSDAPPFFHIAVALEALLWESGRSPACNCKVPRPHLLGTKHLRKVWVAEVLGELDTDDAGDATRATRAVRVSLEETRVLTRFLHAPLFDAPFHVRATLAGVRAHMERVGRTPEFRLHVLAFAHTAAEREVACSAVERLQGSAVTPATAAAPANHLVPEKAEDVEAECMERFRDAIAQNPKWVTTTTRRDMCAAICRAHECEGWPYSKIYAYMKLPFDAAEHARMFARTGRSDVRRLARINKYMCS